MGGVVLIRRSAPEGEPLLLAEAKLFLRITHAVEDALIESLIRVARESAERYLRRSLLTQEWRAVFSGGVEQTLCLPMGPVQSVEAVTVRYRDGSSEVMDAGRYRLAADGERLLLESAVIAAEVEIDYTAGFGDAAEDVPPCLTQGMLLHVASLYEHRDGPGAASVYGALYAPYRAMGV